VWAVVTKKPGSSPTLGILGSHRAACWSSLIATQRSAISAPGSPQTEKGGWVGDGCNTATLVQAFQAMASRYKGKIFCYELMNEPWSSVGWNRGGENNTGYRGLYQSVGSALLAIDPSGLIGCSGALGNGKISDGLNRRPGLRQSAWQVGCPLDVGSVSYRSRFNKCHTKDGLADYLQPDCIPVTN
jgi:hypothetical protein